MKNSSRAFLIAFALIAVAGCGPKETAKPQETKPQAAAPKPAPKPQETRQETSKDKQAEEAKKEEGYLRLYADRQHKGRQVRITFPKNVRDLDSLKFNDICSSAQFEVPSGWVAVLYEDKDFKKSKRVLVGKGSKRDLGNMNDKCSSVRWEKRG